MRTVFLGTSEFAAAVLERLAAGAHRPVLAITRPDRPAGRGRKLRSPAVADAARALGIELAQPVSVNEPDARELIGAAEPEAVIVCAFGALIKEPLLSDHELLNVHPSLLPRWRGAAPVERAMMAGDVETGVSIMRLTAGLDSGPVCLAQKEGIAADDTYGSLVGRLERIGADLLVSALDTLQRGEELSFAEQDDLAATYAEKILAEDRLLDPARPASELERVVRALHPHIGARLRLPDGELLGVLRARAHTTGGPPADSAPEPGAIDAVEGRLLYGTAQGALELLEVQPAGKRPMDAASYLRGHAV
ncbi:MAG: methionyl-tRNA formyltransferase [Solirubrobacteraceae bacterium]